MTKTNKPTKTRINLQIDDTMAIMLKSLKASYPIFGDVDIIKLAINDFYLKNKTQSHKEWVDSLPVMEITKEQEAQIGESIASGFSKQYSSAKELMADLL